MVRPSPPACSPLEWSRSYGPNPLAENVGLRLLRNVPVGVGAGVGAGVGVGVGVGMGVGFDWPNRRFRPGLPRLASQFICTPGPLLETEASRPNGPLSVFSTWLSRTVTEDEP